MEGFQFSSADELYHFLERASGDILQGIGTATISRQRVYDIFDACSSDIKRAEEHNMVRDENGESFKPDHIKCAAHLGYWMRRFTPVVNFAVNDNYRANELILKKYEEMNSKITDLYSVEIIENLEELNSLQEQVDVFKQELKRDVDFYKAYTNEYLAFSISYQLCLQYAESKASENNRLASDYKRLIPSQDFIRSICYTFKMKNVSPHAYYIILLSLIEGRV